MRDSRKKLSKTDSLISWNVDGEIVAKTLDERLKEVRSQAKEKTREGDFICSSGYSKKMDGSIQASARVEPKESLPIEDQISPENIVEYTTTEGETFDVEKIRKEMSRSSLLSSIIGLPLSGDLEKCRVSDVTSQHPEVLRLKKELANRDKEIVKEKLEKQNYKDLLAEKEYRAFQKDRLKAENGSGSSTHQILWLMVDEYKRAVMDSVDKKRIYKQVFFGLKRFKKFRQRMYKVFGKSIFPKERSMEGYIRIAEAQLYYKTKNEEFNITDSGRPTNEFKNYIPKYPEDIKSEPPKTPKPSEPPKPKIDLDAMDEEFLKDD